MIFKTFTSFAVASIAFAFISCAPTKKDPYDTGELYGYPDAAYDDQPDGGSLYDAPADFQDTAPDTATTSTTYTVAAGDTLSKIANKNGVTVKAIMDANNLTNPNLVRIGQKLTIPGH